MPSFIEVGFAFFSSPWDRLFVDAARIQRTRTTGRELATGRKIAIKKIKVGQFKDGLDMSAVREVKYLRELHHPNIIEVRAFVHMCRARISPLT
jgi:serine/threonine protein kinase